MPPSCPPYPVAPAVDAKAAANEAVRRYVRAHGDRPWTARDLAELSELQRAYLEAERGYVRAA